MSTHSQYRLLAERRFAPLFWTQFLGAANDNIFKFSLTLLATYHAAEWGGLDAKSVGFVIAGIFIAPFVLFSATAGQLADKIEKGRIMRFVKNLEIAIMALAAYGFLTHHASALYMCVFLMGLPHRGRARTDRRAVRAAVTLVRPGPAHQLGSLQRNVAQPEDRRARPRGVPLAPRHLVAVVLRLGLPHVVHAVRARRAGRRRERGDAAPRGVLDRHRHGVAPLRALVGAENRDRARALRLHRPDDLRRGPVARHTRH